ncbi:efflux RND transporter periplasmic adaptor subunit [Ahrensia sp. R2A130]|uniref:efflux RND transporter periplasmic adaptor subunit n=1 Tax=Ahrensia sp. R2A130 TaxID=744979 RepID=UPI0001E09C23|nr:efflux RND transporter periplasmic adaptor subunit [Ahrensia sp. R2A130]EFL90626.1 RND family efflux transporter MFP subunit [Ahrensia sp. R2A130]
MQLRGSHLVSFAILAAIGGWMFTGNLILGGQGDGSSEPIADREAKRVTEAFRVRVTELQPTERVSNLSVRGRTEADATISVRAETGGTVEQRLVSKGDTVKAGDLLCVIDQGIRQTTMIQAQARLNQAQADFDATNQLVERGFATRTKLRELQAGLNAAEAAVASAKQEMSRTEIRATTAGLVQSPTAQVGDNLAPGGVCVTLLDTDPMLFTGQVAEANVVALTEGMKAEVELIGGVKVPGKLSFISPAADAATRTFGIEIELQNSDRMIRDGLTAEASIPLAATQAYQLESAWITLADDGEVGVRAVDTDNKVSFHPITILAQDQTGIWVSGLTPGLKVITLGQNFVAAGETVEAVPADTATAPASETAPDAPTTELTTNEARS